MFQAPPEDSVHGLPVLSRDERQHVARMLAHLHRIIAADQGWISFADYMNAVLYAPGLGYYAAGAHKLGEGGDFVTAPELTPLFGRALAQQLQEVFARVESAELIELGPGSGRLCADILSALAECDALPARYALLEVSPDLRERQHAHLASAVPEHLSRVQWIDVLPERWSGVVLANEVLDAVPVQLVGRKSGEWFERGVSVEADGALRFADRPLASPGLVERARAKADGALRFADRPLASPGLVERARARFPADGDYLSEINPIAEALVSSLARRCVRGLLLILDYGFPAHEYYHPQRISGTLMVHHRHRAFADPFFRPGLADLTAHVDFSAIAHAGAESGMTVAGFTTQAQFLINCGLVEALAKSGDPQGSAYLRAASAVQKLTSPAEMGELIKVLALTRGVDPALVGFREGDRAHRL